MSSEGVANNNVNNNDTSSTIKKSEDTEETLNAKYNIAEPIGQTMAYANYVWSGFQLFLLAVNFATSSKVDFGEIPGFSTIYGIAEAENNLHARINILTALFLFQLMQMTLSDIYLTGISERSVRKLDWFLMTFTVIYVFETGMTIYSLFAIHREILFFCGTVAFIITKFYAIFMARRLQNLCEDLNRLHSRRIIINTSNVRPDVVDLEASNNLHSNLQ